MSDRKVDQKIIRPKHIIEQFGICHKTVYNWIYSGFLPRPRRIGPQMVGWFVGDLDAFYKSMDVDGSAHFPDKP